MHTKLERLLSKSLTTLEVMTYYLVVHTGPGSQIFLRVSCLWEWWQSTRARLKSNQWKWGVEKTAPCWKPWPQKSPVSAVSGSDIQCPWLWSGSRNTFTVQPAEAQKDTKWKYESNYRNKERHTHREHAMPAGPVTYSELEQVKAYLSAIQNPKNPLHYAVKGGKGCRLSRGKLLMGPAEQSVRLVRSLIELKQTRDKREHARRLQAPLRVSGARSRVHMLPKMSSWKNAEAQ